MERAQLIQRWFEREQRQLQDKQAWYQSNQVRAAGQDRTAKAQHTTMGARRVSPSPPPPPPNLFQSLITPEQEEEYVSFCSEAIFRINVLQKVGSGRGLKLDAVIQCPRLGLVLLGLPHPCHPPRLSPHSG